MSWILTRKNLAIKISLFKYCTMTEAVFTKTEMNNKQNIN